MKQFKQLIQLKVVVCAMFLLGVASMEARSFQEENESGSSNKFAITASATSICSTGDVTLTADVIGGTVTWLRNNKKYGTGQSITVSGEQAAGTWIAIHTIDGCNTHASNTINISVYSQPPVLSWKKEPADTLFVGYTDECSITASPAADSYLWTSSTISRATVTAMPIRDKATLNAISAGTTTIIVEATNACGTSELQKGVRVVVPSSRITTFTNVMYDFQHQTFTAYTTDGSVPIAYQWQVSTSSDDASFQNIAEATNSASYTVPAHFADSRGDSLYFRCLLSYSSKVLKTNNLNILFIKTNTGGYGTLNGVRYLTINRGGTLNGGKIKVALLNLGASGTGSLNTDPMFDDSLNLNDAGDLGDFYQWGRIADGHQHVVWSKNLNSDVNKINPMTGNGATSAVVTQNITAMAIDTQGQVTGVGYVGNFIPCNGCDWGVSYSDSWGNTSTVRGGTPISFNGSSPAWTTRAQANNVCPSGWRIPSRFEFWDMYRGNGSNNPTNVSSNAYNTNSANNNIWQYRATNAGAYGGVIITNNNGEKVFFPVVGFRIMDDGTLTTLAGRRSVYWSSTNEGLSNGYNMLIDTDEVSINFNARRSHGDCVRCITE